MQPNTDYKKLLSEVIQKQMVILGPSIALAKARNVQGSDGCRRRNRREHRGTATGINSGFNRPVRATFGLDS